MKVYEFGKEHTRSFAMFQCAVEPWWVFKASAEEMAKDYHVYLFIADGHDELGTEFISLEKYAKDAAAHLRAQGIGRVDAMYGVQRVQRPGPCGTCNDVPGAVCAGSEKIPGGITGAQQKH